MKPVDHARRAARTSAALVLVATSTAGVLTAQDSSGEVLAAGPGYVEFSYPVRPGACGDGDNISLSRHRYHHGDRECHRGPGRVRLRISSGQVAEAVLRVGQGLPAAGANTTNLGKLSAESAAATLISLTYRARDAEASKLVFAAVLAEDQLLQQQLEEMALADRASLDARKAAVFWLGQAYDQDDSDRLARIMENGSLPMELRETALFAVSQEDSPAALQVLTTTASSDGPAKLRESAIFWLGQQEEAEALATLSDLYRRLRDDDLREKALFAISQHESADASRWLLERVTDQTESAKLRKNALFWLGQRGDSREILVDLYRTIADRDLKEQLIFAYSQNELLLDQLLAVAREETDPELRKNALFWLGQSNDPAAIDYLEELINN